MVRLRQVLAVIIVLVSVTVAVAIVFGTSSEVCVGGFEGSRVIHGPCRGLGPGLGVLILFALLTLIVGFGAAWLLVRSHRTVS